MHAKSSIYNYKSVKSEFLCTPQKVNSITKYAHMYHKFTNDHLIYEGISVFY